MSLSTFAHRLAAAWLLAVPLLLTAGLPAFADAADGKVLYGQLCASCHGPQGQGVAGRYDEALYGERPLAELIRIIDETMPAEEPEKCSGDQAAAVGKYIYEAFYTAAARAKNKPPRVELSRLTVPQHAQVPADLVGSFTGQRSISDKRGLRAQYYNDRRFRGDQRKIDRVDATVDQNFGTGSPGKDIETEAFSIRWEGSLIVESSGEYEIGVRTENGFQLWVNGTGEPFVDGYVAAGPEPVLRSARQSLLGGRAYPLKLEYFKFKGKTASVQLMWKPPHKTWEVIPERHLTPDRTTPTLVIQTPFPADDGSLGYPRGTSVSQAWNEAATFAAVEVATHVVQNLDSLAKTKPDAGDRDKKVREFCARFAELAFRRPLTDEQRRIYVDAAFADEEDLRAAAKRSVLMTLTSPWFLYTEVPRDEKTDGYDVAARLALAMWDSLPDEALYAAAAKDELKTREAVLAHARRMGDDPRAKAKLRGFFTQWLQLDHTDHLAKDEEHFPGFDAELMSALRTSLELFLDDCIDSEAADYRQLLLADYWYVNADIAEFYGLKVPDDGRFHRVKAEDSKRAGVVTHPFLLASLSYHNATSPIHRGVFATRKLLNRALNPPPMAIEFTDAGFDPHLTMREKVTELTSATSCQNCHSIINPLGFSLENFDAVGRFRTMEKERPIDATGVYTALDGKPVKLSGARDLAEYAAGSGFAQQGFIEQLFHHTVKQPPAAYGSTTMEDLHRSFSASGYNIRTLLVEIATTAARK